jgi:single-stranded-DNA-specific exonuclease
MLKSKTRWKIRKAEPIALENLASELNITPLVAGLLINRGITEPEAARAFLFDQKNEFHDPFLLHDMKEAVERIKLAIETKEPILVFGDYDADGVSSTTVMMSVLSDLGADAEFYIPNRFTEGYGPNEAAFRHAAESGKKLIITVDTGIAAVNEAQTAKELGMDLIITDHHEPGPVLPEALAIVHPKHPESHYPFHELAGVGVAFKLAHALYGFVPEHLLDVVTIGTIADLVPLIGENRTLVKAGLKQLAKTERPGIQALCKVTGTELSEVNEETIGFVLAPRLNAAGRLDSADPAVDLLMCTDMEDAIEMAKQIDAMNKERQAIVNEMTTEAIQMVESQYPTDQNRVIVIGKEGWNPGVVGIVASRLVEKFYRPTIVLSFDSEMNKAKGSARSIAGFNLFEHLSTCREILPHFGGHPMAAGMTLSIDDVKELRTRLNQIAFDVLKEEDLIPVAEIDAVVKLEDIHLEAVQELTMLAPYGTANPKPKVVIERVPIKQLRKIGAGDKHLKVSFGNDGSALDGIGFGMGEFADHISPISAASVMGELAVNEWNNIRKPQIFMKDIKVQDWQLFDIRGIKQWKKWVSTIPKTDSQFIVFQESTIETFKQAMESFPFYHIREQEEARRHAIDGKTIVLMDLPSEDSLLHFLVNGKKPDRIYAYFHHEQDHFFSTFPTREHFKWYYGFLSKRKSFDMIRYGDQLAAYKGWSRETVDFISQVFFELDFVTIKDGLISIHPVKSKRDLTESTAYQKKEAQFKLENELLYSSYQDLKRWFDERIQWSVKHEEEVR